MKSSSLSKIFHHFGRMNQIFKLMEELAELIRALSIAIARYGLNPDRILADPDVITEMADVVLLLKQFSLLSDLRAALESEADIKTARTIERIESDYYGGGDAR